MNIAEKLEKLQKLDEPHETPIPPVSALRPAGELEYDSWYLPSAGELEYRSWSARG